MKEDRPVYDRLVDKKQNTALVSLIVIASLAGLVLGGFIAYRSYHGSDTPDSSALLQAKQPVPQEKTTQPAATTSSTQAPAEKTKPRRRRAVQEPQTDTVSMPRQETTESGEAVPKSDSLSVPTPKPDHPSTAASPQLPVPPPAEPTNIPPPTPAPAVPEKPVYRGPMSGVANWVGKLDKNGTLTINAGTPSIGVLTGAGLPGVPVRLTIDQTNLGIAETPNAANGYRRLVLRSHGKHDRITIHWAVSP